MFWQKKNDNNTKFINSAEYDLCLKRISELNSKLSIFEASLNNIEEKLENLRYSIRTKLKIVKEQEEEQKEESLAVTENINNSGYVPFG